jgi:hypothetical protein
VDELGPLAAKTYPGAEWKVGAQRATFEPDYGRRGKLLVFSDARDSASHITLLEQIMIQYPADRWLVIEDNLSTHTSRKVGLALLAWHIGTSKDIPIAGKNKPWRNP